MILEITSNINYIAGILAQRQAARRPVFGQAWMGEALLGTISIVDRIYRNGGTDLEWNSLRHNFLIMILHCSRWCPEVMPDIKDSQRRIDTIIKLRTTWSASVLESAYRQEAIDR